MSVALSMLAPDEFVALCGRLLEAAGFAIQVPARDAHADYLATDSQGRTILVECASPRESSMRPQLQASMDRLGRGREFLQTDRALLMTSLPVPQRVRHELLYKMADVAIWDATDLDDQLASKPELLRATEQLLSARGRLSLPTAPQPLRTRGDALKNRLRAVAPGRPSFRDFEDVGTDILNFVFGDSLGTPWLQSRSEDGLDIRDAIYPITASTGPWNWWRSACSTWFVVAEFKNFSDAPGQKEVESLQQYLFVRGMRSLGFLVCRKPPSDHAIHARRRTWLESQKLIVFLSDADLESLIAARVGGDEVEALVTQQLIRFFATVTP
jgi:hypothetical protein